MQIVTSQAAPIDSPHDLVVLGLFAGEHGKSAAFKAFDAALGGALAAAVKDQDFAGKAKQTLTMPTLGHAKARRVALVGLGARNKASAESFVRLGGMSTRLGNSVGAQQVLVALPDKHEAVTGALEAVARGAHLGAYRFDAYKSDKGRGRSVKKMALHPADGSGDKDGLKRAQVVAESIAMARDLVNQPALDLYPETFAARAMKEAKSAGVTCQVLKPEQLRKKNMNLLLAVGQGSERGPRLVHLTYTPAGRKAAAKAAPLVLVGKGITFDSGGLCLKPPDGMLSMKIDMAGAAAVLAAMVAIGKLKGGRTVHGILALAENMPSGSAYRPSDVFTSAAGKTVEVTNTDAEGRLVLADALHYAGQLKPASIIDLATLTGACMVALGPATAGLFANDEAWAEQVSAAAKRQGEEFWRLPLTPGLKDQLKSETADLRNSGDRMGGAITAALFLQEFVGATPWAHVDMAGPATTHEDAGANTKGATGFAVATLVDLALRGDA